MEFFKNERFSELFGDFLTKSDRKMSESWSFLKKIWASSFLRQKEGSKSQGEFGEFFEKNCGETPDSKPKGHKKVQKT